MNYKVDRQNLRAQTARVSLEDLQAVGVVVLQEKKHSIQCGQLPHESMDFTLL